MKKKVLALVLGLSLFASGIAAASSQWGQYRGQEIVRVLVNGTEIKPEIPAHIRDGSTFLPLRAIGEALGAKVEWQGDTYTATVDMPKPALSLTQLNKIGESVGLVYAIDGSGKAVSQGSGFLLSNGVFVTCEHVVTKAASLQIVLNRKTYTTTQYLFRNATADLAAVRIDATSGLNYSTDLPPDREKAYSLGFDHGKFEINDGYVVGSSSAGIMNTAKSEPGSSGGILTRSDGTVIGVMATGDDTIAYNKSIPMSVLQQELDKLK